MEEGHNFLLEQEAAEGLRRRREESDAVILQSIIRGRMIREDWDRCNLLLAQADTQGRREAIRRTMRRHSPGDSIASTFATEIYMHEMSSTSSNLLRAKNSPW